MSQQHHILLGRVANGSAASIFNAFGRAPNEGLVISEPDNIFQSYFGKVGHESIFELFVTGKQPDHPIEQNLLEAHRAQIENGMKGDHVTIVHSISGANTSGRAMSLLDGVAYLKDVCEVGSITLIAPHMAFMRNDRRFRRMLDGQVIDQRNAIASKTYARRLKREGVNEIISFEAHSQAGIDHFKKQFGEENVTFHTMQEFAAYAFIENHNTPIIDLNGNWTLSCGAPDGLNKPDDLGISRAKMVGLSLYENTSLGKYTAQNTVDDIPWMFGIHKDRINSEETKILRFSGDISGRNALIIDDIIAGGSTTILAARRLKEEGALSCTAYVTHGVLDGDSIKKLADDEDLDHVIISDSIPGVAERLKKAGELGPTSKFHVASLGNAIVQDIKNIHAQRQLEWSVKPAALQI